MFKKKKMIKWTWIFFKDWKKCIVLSVKSVKISKRSNVLYIFNKSFVLSTICDKCGSNNNITFQKKNLQAYWNTKKYKNKRVKHIASNAKKKYKQ